MEHKYIPDEIWEAILNNLDSSADQLACYKTCQTWNRILKPDRTTWMFGEILPILYPYLGKSTALLCRRVCPTWCSVVDSFILLKDPDNFLTNLFKGSDLEETVAKFHSDMNGATAATRPIFIARHVRCGLTRSFISTFLPAYGTKIWKMELLLHPVRLTSPFQLLEAFKIFFRTVPNIRQLLFHTQQRDFVREDDAMAEAFTSYLTQNVYSVTPNLEMIDIYLKPTTQRALEFNQQIAYQIIDQNSSHLQNLRLNTFYPFGVTTAFPKLKTLTILIEDFGNLVSQILNLEQLSDALETLCLYLPEGLETTPPPDSKTAGRDYQFPKWQLPHLKNLTIEGIIGTDAMSFDFLLGLQSLETFSFAFRRYRKEGHVTANNSNDDGETEIEVHKYLSEFGKDLPENQLYFSNIWTVLPKLDKIYMEKTYTREGMENFKQTCCNVLGDS